MPRLTDSEIEQVLASLDGWRREGDELVRDYVLHDFVASMGLLTQIGVLAERANHHPTLTNTYNRVRVALSTHDAGGITERDVSLAREIEERA
ncbi:MAG: 4a-hydroxytetrahydrobiopterin dehydratase [Dehalococcoidia bacterium]|nr:4a-hydroxytetrahydrobiopterin dehydratase [Dehalococcoidia bacterium]